VRRLLYVEPRLGTVSELTDAVVTFLLVKSRLALLHKFGRCEAVHHNASRLIARYLLLVFVLIQFRLRFLLTACMIN
jgi:hypothetical protein